MDEQGLPAEATGFIIRSRTTLEQIITALVWRGCADLTSLVDEGSSSQLPVTGGGFCDLYQGVTKNGQKIAIKNLRHYDNSNGDNSKKILKRAARELYYWSQLEHPNVLPLMGLAIFRKRLSMISQWMENGDLVTFIRQNPSVDKLQLCIDVCSGLSYIHSQSLVHGDLKGPNVLISSYGVAMIADFGNVLFNGGSTLQFTDTTSYSHSVRWVAPELFKGEGAGMPSAKGDVYSYGMVVLETLTGEVPFKSLGVIQVIGMLSTGGSMPERPESCADDDLWRVMQCCWAKEASERPDAADLEIRMQKLRRHLPNGRLSAPAAPRVRKNNPLFLRNRLLGVFLVISCIAIAAIFPIFMSRLIQRWPDKVGSGIKTKTRLWLVDPYDLIAMQEVDRRDDLGRVNPEDVTESESRPHQGYLKVSTLPHVSHDESAVDTSHPNSAKLKYFPRPTFMFKGRRLHLEQLNRYFENETIFRHVFVIHGLGGSGKTETALKWVEDSAHWFEGVIFVDGSSQSSIEMALRQFAVAKNIGKDHSDTLQWLEQRSGRWLVLFDNVDDPNVRVYEYYPRGNKYDVLITTRHTEVTTQAQGPNSDCEVGEMEPDDALELLLHASRTRKDTLLAADRAIAQTLLREFGYLALAIVQCGAFIRRTQDTFPSYYGRYLSARRETLEGSGMSLQIDRYNLSVYTAWALNKPRDGTVTERLWKLFIHMRRNGITEDTFRRAYENLHVYKSAIPPSESEVHAREQVSDVLRQFTSDGCNWDSRLFRISMGELLSTHMVSLDPIHNVYQMHPLVQQWARTDAPEANALEKTSFLLALSINSQIRVGDYAYRQTILPHVTELLEHYPTPNSNDLWHFAAVYATMGDTYKAEPLQTLVMEGRINALGHDHPDTLHIMGYLSIAWEELGRTAEAEEMKRQVLATRRRVLGDRDHMTLAGMVNLAWTYRSQGRLEEAEALELEAVTIRKHDLGEDHTDTLLSKGTLALTYQSQGRFAEAEALELEVMTSRRRVIGEDHPHTLWAMANLAVTYRSRGRLADAESLEIDLLAVREKVLGKDHPDTLAGKSNLAYTNLIQGQAEVAESRVAEVVAARKRVLGRNHPHTLASVSILALAYHKQGRLAEAEPLWFEVVTARKRVLGDDHSNTLLGMQNQALTLRDQGRLVEAELIQVEVVADRKLVLGQHHPDTLTSVGHLASIYRSQGRVTEAERLWVEITNSQQRAVAE